MSQDPGSRGAILSMTGFGRALEEVGDDAFEVDIRSVNHRGLKLSFRVPDHFSVVLPKMDALIKTCLGRGAVTLTARQTSATRAGRYRLDADLVRTYFRALSELSDELGGGALDLVQVARLPGAIIEGEGGEDGREELWQHLEPVVRVALGELIALREREGRGIGEDLRACFAEMDALAGQVEELVPGTIDRYRDKLEQRIQRLLEGSELEPDPRELAQQLAHFADRSDISEELQRLRSHIRESIDTLDRGGACGRKLEFLAQELQREANTMSAKSHGLELVNRVLEIKLLVDRVREQAANIE